MAQDHQGDDDGWDQGQAYEGPIICIFNGDGAWNHLPTSLCLAVNRVSHLI
jgi:hypothetical protein